MRLNVLTVGLLTSLCVALPSESSAETPTREFTDPSAFASATRNRVSIGFDRILPTGSAFQSFSPLTHCGMTFSTPNPGTSVYVTRADFYSPANYQGDFIVDSANAGPDNELLITFGAPTRAVALEYGGLGFNGAGTAIITLSNGHVFTSGLPAVGRTQFIGFLSREPITSLSLTTTNDSWVVTRVILADYSRPAAVDRRDNGGSTIHFMYVLPCDGADEKLDTDGTLSRSIEAFQRWLEGETGRRRLRVDEHGQSPEITFLRLGRRDLEIASHGVFVREELEQEVHAAGFNEPGKIYAVYYGGRSNVSCGAASWPPDLTGNVVALYLFGEPPGAPPCSTNEFASSPDTPGYLEFAMLHEIVHALGFVARCAPNHVLNGHVSDDPRDLMYAGNLPWQPSILDIGRNDYYGHANSGCLDLQDSTFLTRVRK